MIHIGENMTTLAKDSEAKKVLKKVATPILRSTGFITKQQCENILKDWGVVRYAPQHGKIQIVGAPISKYFNEMIEQNNDIKDYRYKAVKGGRVFGPKRRGIAVVEQ